MWPYTRNAGVFKVADKSKEAKYRRLATTLLGTQSLDLRLEDFLSGTFTSGSNNAGSGAHKSDTPNCMSCTTTANGADQGQVLLYTSLNGGQEQVATGTSAEFFIAAELQANFAANASAFAGFSDGAASAFKFGYDGASSLNGWTLKLNGVTLSGGTFSTSMTRLYAVRKAGLTSFYVNGVFISSSANAYFAADTPWCLSLLNGGSAVARRIDADAYVIGAPSARQAFP